MNSDGTCENSQVSASKNGLTLAALTCNWQLKLALNGEIINIMSAYGPQTGCGENEKIKFWEEMDEELRGDFNGHCGRNNSGKEETIGKYGVGESSVLARIWIFSKIGVIEIF